MLALTHTNFPVAHVFKYGDFKNLSSSTNHGSVYRNLKNNIHVICSEFVCLITLLFLTLDHHRRR